MLEIVDCLVVPPLTTGKTSLCARTAPDGSAEILTVAILHIPIFLMPALRGSNFEGSLMVVGVPWTCCARKLASAARWWRWTNSGGAGKGLPLGLPGGRGALLLGRITCLGEPPSWMKMCRP